MGQFDEGNCSVLSLRYAVDAAAPSLLPLQHAAPDTAPLGPPGSPIGPMSPTAMAARLAAAQLAATAATGACVFPALQVIRCMCRSHTVDGTSSFLATHVCRISRLCHRRVGSLLQHLAVQASTFRVCSSCCTRDC
jgi:hypothetical protein